MASNAGGSTQSLTASRVEGLHALLSKLSPGDVKGGEPMSNEQLMRISDKLGDLLGDAPDGERRSERGELLNEEGLPIIDITEPVPALDEDSDAAQPSAPPLPLIPGHGPRALTPLSPEELAHDRAEIDSFFDLLEAEEAVEEVRNEEHDRQREREELERRKANAAKELERLRSAKAMQKKMGKALLRGLSEGPASQQPAPVLRMDPDGNKTTPEGATVKGKKVSFAQDIPGEEISTPRAANPASNSRPTDLGQPMKFKIVERNPTKPPPMPVVSVTSAADGDSDDESMVAPSDDGDEVLSTADSPPTSDHAADDSEGDLPEDPVEVDEIDFDDAMHQREIALAYYEKRATIGQEAARAMAAHSHEPVQHEWDQPDVPLDANLTQAGPRAASRFKASRVAQAYSTSVPRSTLSTSLGGSVLPGDVPTLRSAIRLGKLEDNGLVGGEEGESGSELEDDDDARAFMDAMRRGEITNAGAVANADALVAALTAAYGGSTPSESASGLSTAADTPVVSAPPSEAPLVTPEYAKPKASKFKLVRGLMPSVTPPVGVATPATDDARSSPKLPTSEAVFKRKTGTTVKSPSGFSVPAAAVPSATLSKPAASAPPPEIINSTYRQAQPHPTQMAVAGSLPPQPSSSVSSPTAQNLPLFPPPPPGAKMPSMIVDSPSFPRSSSSRPTRPPTVMSASVLERKASVSGTCSATEHGAGSGPQKKVSRFMAGRS
ncbi:hypothetical protein K488DRAFT_83925 [Vararia minispora EC-137]|uniref:Uncharacterized protein n=1 Tax=Vararia minispora EC-137 TaxID=1314806 RepID=A0ACB8QS66_9AGAM|nr:hypothetical protein K488DRAFT_83925 [Vararia minispora EC-137]